jgi:hypothetical protein
MLTTLLYLLLTGVLGDRTGTYPPEGAHLLGTEPVVPLHWDLPGKDFYLTVTAAGRTVFQGAVSGNSYDLPVRSGSLVRWNVVPVGQAGLASDFHSFQYSNQAIFRFQGKAGAPPRVPPRSLDGVPGAPGMDGPAISVQLQQTREGVSLQIESQKYLLLPSTRPIRVECVGGDGGEGGPGQQGMAGMSGFVQSSAYLDGGPGGTGGDGGNGGRGGLITVFSNGLPVEPLLQFDVSGGRPGPPGPGGPGGVGGFYQGRRTTLAGRPGPDGQAGRPGQNGPPGQVIVRP